MTGFIAHHYTTSVTVTVKIATAINGGFIMSSFSRSHSNGSYPYPHRGQSHYKRNGFWGKIMGGFSNSFSGDKGGYRRYPQQGYPYQDYPPQYQQPSYPQSPTPMSENTAVCPKCKTAVPAGSKFCLSCGEKMNTASFCPECGRQIPSASKFCPECGHKIR